MIPLAKATHLAWRIIETLQPHCLRIKIAGSARRQRPKVKDTGIVAIPHDIPSRHAIIARCAARASPSSSLDSPATFRARAGPDGWTLDLPLGA